MAMPASEQYLASFCVLLALGTSEAVAAAGGRVIIGGCTERVHGLASFCVLLALGTSEAVAAAGGR